MPIQLPPAVLQEALDRVGDEVRARHEACCAAGSAPHNLAILIEELATGDLKPLVAVRSQVASALDLWTGERATPIVAELGKPAPAGMTHAVFAMRRDATMVLVHRLTVVQGTGKN